MSYRCCDHCAEDPVHDVDTDRHAVPCSGGYGVCSSGGDEWTPEPTRISPYEDDSDWCYGCDSEGWACTCG